MKHACHSIIAGILVLVCATTARAQVNPVKALFYAATQAFSDQDFARAASLYKKIIELNPDFALAYYYLGLVQRETNTDLEIVAGTFERAVELDPKMAPAHDSLARVYYALGRFDEAQKEAATALAIDPNLVSAQLSMGWISLLGKSQPQEAITYFSKVATEQDLPYAHFGLGLAYFINGEQFKVLEMITNLRRIGRDDFAEHLERMVRENRYFAPVEEGKPLLLLPQQNVSVAGIDETVPFDDDNALADTPVRLRAAAPETNMPPPADGSVSKTPAERISELRERGRTIPEPRPTDE
jgi:tetratricopeptide (TPR) repeat protein